MKININDFLNATFGSDIVAIPIPDFKKFPSIKGWQTYTDGLTTNKPTTYGINCGLSKLVVIDLDVHNENENGIESFKALLKEHGIESLNTFTVRTGSGGLHLYFRYEGDDIKNTVGKTGIRDGIDVRANGGQVVGPFSKVEQKDGSFGEYTIAKNAPVMDLPKWLADECRNAMGKNKVKKTSSAVSFNSSIIVDGEMDNYAKAALSNCIIDVSSATEGSRNDTLARASFGAAAAGVPVETVVDRLSAAARVNGMEEREINNTVRRCAEEGAQAYVPREKTTSKASKASVKVDVEELVKSVSEDVAERVRRDAEADISDLLDDDQLTDMFIQHSLKNEAIYLDDLKKWFFYSESEGIWKGASERWAQAPADKFLKARKKELKEAKVATKVLNQLTANGKLYNVASRASVRMAVTGNTSEHFGTNLDAVVLGDGVYDFKSDEFKAYSPDYRSLQKTEVKLRLDDDSVDRTNFNKLLSVIPEDALEYMQVALGSGLVGHQASVDPSIIFLNGRGGNGKSSLLMLAERVYGNYAKRPLPEVFQKGSDIRFAMKDFADARTAIFEELPEAHFLNAVSVKRLVGSPSQTTDVKFGDSMEVSIGATIFVSTNFLPTVTETDDGTWRRLRTLNFTKKFTSNPNPKNPNELQADPNLSPESIKKLDVNDDLFTAALQWFVEGARIFMKNNKVLPPVPTSMALATSQWQDNNDRMANWANMYFEVGTNNDFVLSSDVFDCYHYHTMTVEKAKSALNQTNFWSQFVEHRWFLNKGLEKKRERVGKKMEHSEWSNPVKKRTDFGYLPARPTGDKVMIVRGIKFRDPDVDYDPAEALSPAEPIEVVEETVEQPVKDMDLDDIDLDFDLDFDILDSIK